MGDVKTVYLEKRDVFQYPSSNDNYSPHIFYPEYPFPENTISSKPNEVYDMVRASLYGLKLDSDRYGKPEWNPLGDYVNKGAHILIKPNLVNHTNHIGGLDCTVTHPSVIRCIIDYCIIAGASLIEVADAPIQNCDFDRLMDNHGYNKLFHFMRENGINLCITDFRLTKTRRYSNGVYLQKKGADTGKAYEYDLEELSFFNTLPEGQRYGIANYSDKTVNDRHNSGHHKYLIAKSVMDADLVINLVKPKTHRFAGITGAQKNFIGICSDKESLPHFRRNIKANTSNPENSGDEFDKPSQFTSTLSFLDQQRCKHIEKQNYFMQLFFIAIKGIYKRLGNILGSNKSRFSSGQWWGNDTIWRTILDLNLILLYGKPDGTIELNRPPRRILAIGDLIIAGEKYGPLEPSPKPLGIILSSNNFAAFDYAFCLITGFDWQVIPTVKKALDSSLFLGGTLNEVTLRSNIEEYNDITLDKAPEFPHDWNFIPNPLWDDVLLKK